MLNYTKRVLDAIWQRRFQYGVSGGFGGFGLMKYANGWVVQGSGPELQSPGTGHWPWFLFEFGRSFTTVPSWHVGILGFTFGMRVLHDVDLKEQIVGPDYKSYYWFFKGLNHKDQDLGEII